MTLSKTELDAAFQRITKRIDGLLTDEQLTAVTEIVENERSALSVVEPRKRQKPPVGPKVCFTVSVVMVVLSTIATTHFPYTMPWVHTALTAALLVTRFILYYRESMHYFLLDYCYFANLCTLVYLWATPQYPEAFAIVFSLCNGPLLGAVVLWRNSFVFHSLDKMTSVFIHLWPCLLLFCLRWFPPPLRTSVWPPPPPALWWPWEVCLSPGCTSVPLEYFVALPLAAYVSWQLLYLFRVNVLARSKTKLGQQTLVTSYNYMMTHNRSSFVHRVITIAGVQRAEVMFVLLQLCYTTLFFFPAILMYMYFWVNAGVLLAVVAVLAWNGGAFYVYQFTKLAQSSASSASTEPTSPPPLPLSTRVAPLTAKDDDEAKTPAVSGEGGQAAVTGDGPATDQHDEVVGFS